MRCETFYCESLQGVAAGWSCLAAIGNQRLSTRVPHCLCCITYLSSIMPSFCVLPRDETHGELAVCLSFATPVSNTLSDSLTRVCCFFSS